MADSEYTETHGSFGSDVSTQVDQIHEAIGHALSRDVVLQCLQGAGGFGERALLSWLRRVLLLWIGLVAFAKVPCTTASFLLILGVVGVLSPYPKFCIDMAANRHTSDAQRANGFAVVSLLRIC